MPTVASVADRIRREGETVVLKRTGAADLEVAAFVRGYRADELVEDIMQGDRQLTISNVEIAAAGWPGPPKLRDGIMIRGRSTSIMSCETRMLRGAVAMHVIQVRGG